MPAAKPIRFKDITYSSLSEACRELRVPRHRVLSRIRIHGMDIEEALLEVWETEWPVLVRGQKYRTMADASRDYGIDPSVVYKRTAMGWSLADALTTPLTR